MKSESDFNPPAGWKLLQRREMDCEMPDGRGQTPFYEKWYHSESESGIVAYSTFEASNMVCHYGCAQEAAAVYFVAEGYGIGTLDSNLREIGDVAPIERSEHATLDDAGQALRVLMEENESLFKGGEFKDRQIQTTQLPRVRQQGG